MQGPQAAAATVCEVVAAHMQPTSEKELRTNLIRQGPHVEVTSTHKIYGRLIWSHKHGIRADMSAMRAGGQKMENLGGCMVG